MGAGTGNIDSDPLFTDPGAWDNGSWTDGNYLVLPTSPCIDAGFGDSGATVPTTDIRGLPPGAWRILATSKTGEIRPHHVEMVILIP